MFDTTQECDPRPNFVLGVEARHVGAGYRDRGRSTVM